MVDVVVELVKPVENKINEARSWESDHARESARREASE